MRTALRLLAPLVLLFAGGLLLVLLSCSDPDVPEPCTPGWDECAPGWAWVGDAPGF